MENIYYLLIAFLICWYFIYLRQVSESGKKHAQQYCKQEKLQFIAIARRYTRLSFSKRNGLYMKSAFDFEFSGDGESSYQGAVLLKGVKLDSVDMPAYRI